MLLKMKSASEGIRALAYFCYFCMDNEMNAVLAGNEEQKEYWHGMIEVFTPIVKSYCTDMGMMVCDTGRADDMAVMVSAVNILLSR